MLSWRNSVSRKYKCCFQILHFLHYSTAVCTSTTDTYANYFVHSLGFSRQQALSISSKLSLQRRNKVIDSTFVENANSVVTLFSRLGFNQTHIRDIVSKEPRLLASDIGITLKPKIRALQDENFTLSHIIRVISRRPEILSFGLEPTILPSIHILKQVMGSVTSVSNVVNAIERFTRRHFHLIVTCLLPNVALLTSYGVPIGLIRKHMLEKPGNFVQNPEVFKGIVMKANKKSGFTRYSPFINLMDYLVDSFGFSHQQALSISTKLSLRRRKYTGIDSAFVSDANSVVTLFRNLGFHDTVIRNIVCKRPSLLTNNVDKTLKPIIRLLQDEDFSASDIIRLVSRCPAILCFRSESTILRAIHILKQVMGSVGNVVNAIETFKEWHFQATIRYLLPNVALLTSYGVPIELIRKHMLHKPKCYLQNSEVFMDVVMRVEYKLGITRDSPMFLYGISLMSGMTRQSFESKCRIFMSFGWTQSNVASLMMRNANCFKFSDERIRKKLYFLMNELKLEPAYLISRAVFIICSLEKLIVPRHKILLILKKKGLLTTNPSLYCAIHMSEPRFLKKFVIPFKAVHKAYAKLTGCRLLIQKSAVSTSAAGSYANYLINSLGFSRRQSLCISTKLTRRRKNKVNDFHFVANANSVVTLFHNLGFDKTLIRNIVSKEPDILAFNVGRTLKPKISALQDEYFSASDIIRVISKCPSILQFGLESTILPAIHILNQVMGSVGNVVNAIERFSKWHFCSMVRCLLPNVALLSIYGVSFDSIRKQILYKPKCYVQNPKIFKDIVMRVEKKLRITRDTPMFLYGINLMCGKSKKTFQGNCRIFKRFGWTQSEIETFIIKNASCFTFSDEHLKKKLDFLMNVLELKPAYLTSHNIFLSCSLEKRILPRHKILLILKEEGLGEKHPSLYRVIQLSEPCFLKRFVLPFKQVHQDYAMLTGCSLSMLSEESDKVMEKRNILKA